MTSETPETYQQIINDLKQELKEKDDIIQQLRQEIKELRANSCGLSKEDIKEMEEHRKNIVCDYPKVWKPFVGVEGYGDYPNYEFSNWGEARNSKTKKHIGKIQKDGYVAITMNNKNEPKLSLRLQQIIALLFIPKGREDQTIVNHKNHNRWDNSVINLEWATIQENNNDKGFFKGERIKIRDELPEDSLFIDIVRTRQSIWKFDNLFYADDEFWELKNNQYYQKPQRKNANGAYLICIKPINDINTKQLLVSTIKKQYEML